MPNSPASPPFRGARPVVSAAEVSRALDALATRLQPIVDEADVIMLGVMLGGVVPMVHLADRLDGDFVLDYCRASRYRGSTTGGELQWVQEPHLALKDKTVIIVDDIFDEGITLEFVVNECRSRGARRVVTVVLVQKNHQRVRSTLRPDFIGLVVDDAYVFGAGMDYRNRWRHLPGIWAIDTDEESGQ